MGGRLAYQLRPHVSDPQYQRFDAVFLGAGRSKSGRSPRGYESGQWRIPGQRKDCRGWERDHSLTSGDTKSLTWRIVLRTFRDFAAWKVVGRKSYTVRYGGDPGGGDSGSRRHRRGSVDRMQHFWKRVARFGPLGLLVAVVLGAATVPQSSSSSQPICWIVRSGQPLSVESVGYCTATVTINTAQMDPFVLFETDTGSAKTIDLGAFKFKARVSPNTANGRN
jgi:hypothetical protein